MTKTIRVEEGTHAALKALKGENETFDDLLSRLIEEHRGTIRGGSGLWQGTDAAEKAREKRDEMKRNVGRWRCTTVASSSTTSTASTRP